MVGVRIRTRSHEWVKLVVGSLLCSERFFSGFSGFPLSSKINISKLQFDRMQDLPENHFWVSGASWVNINYYYYYLLGVGRLPPQPESLHRHFSQLKVRKGDFVTTFFGSRSDGESSVLLFLSSTNVVLVRFWIHCQIWVEFVCSWLRSKKRFFIEHV